MWGRGRQGATAVGVTGARGRRGQVLAEMGKLQRTGLQSADEGLGFRCVHLVACQTFRQWQKC